MGSKGDRQDGLAGVGVNRVPPGFARPRDGASDPRVGRAAAGSLRTLLTIDVMNRSRPRWAARRSDAGAGYRAWGAPWESPWRRTACDPKGTSGDHNVLMVLWAAMRSRWRPSSSSPTTGLECAKEFSYSVSTVRFRDRIKVIVPTSRSAA